MLAVRCPERDTLVLLSLVDLEELRNTAGGIEIRYRCSDGHRGRHSTGRARRTDTEKGS